MEANDLNQTDAKLLHRRGRPHMDPGLAAYAANQDDQRLDRPVIPDQCSVSCTPIRKPDVFRAEGAADYDRIDCRVRFPHAYF